MQVDWKRFLEALDCVVIPDIQKLQPCPLHPIEEGTIKVQKDPITGHWRFLCLQPRCAFSGDAVALLSRYLKIPLDQALEHFKPNGSMYHTLENPLLASQVDEYTDSQSNQSYIAAYMNRCQQAFRKDEAIQLRTRMADVQAVYRGLRGDLHGLPQTLGMMVHDDIPIALKEFSKAKYRKGHYAVYPYTFEGVYTAVKAQNFMEVAKPVQEIIVTRPGIGIFMEDEIKPETTEVIVAANELDACILRHKLQCYVINPPAVIALAGLPLPFKYSHIKTVSLVSFPDSILTLKKALQYQAAADIVEGQGRDKITVNVLDFKSKLQMMAGDNINDQMSKYCSALPVWIINNIQSLIDNNRLTEVYTSFSAGTLSNETRTKLIEVARQISIPDSTIKLLRDINTADGDTFVLGDGKVIRRKPTGLEYIRPSNDVVPACNVMIDVAERILTRNGVDYICRFQVPGNSTIVTQRIEVNDRITANRLRSIVEKAFLNMGLSPYIAFYEFSRKASWADVIIKMAEGKKVTRELAQLGVDPELQVHFPNVILDLINKTITQQAKVTYLPEPVQAAYAGLKYAQSMESKEPIRKLVDLAHKNVYLAGLLAGLCHVIAHLRKYTLLAEKGVCRMAPAHMFYVSPEIDTWLPVIHQLSQIFSGNAEPPLLSSMATDKQLEEMRKLGTLPWIVNLAGLKSRSVSKSVDASPVSLISCVDHNTAGPLAEQVNRSFVNINDYRKQETVGLHQTSILELQEILPGLFLEILTLPNVDKELCQYTSNQPPAVAGYKILCTALDIEADDLISKLVTPHYVASKMIGCEAFMDTLHYLLESTQFVHTEIRKPLESDLKSATPPHVFMTEEVVLINKNILTLVNKRGKVFSPFKQQALTDDFEDHGYLRPRPKDINIDENHFWILDKAIWNKYVRKEQLLLPSEVCGNVIRLERIA